MPHNLYLHSALVKTRRIDRNNPVAVTEANRYFFIESGIALGIAFVLNLFVVTVFANSLHGVTYGQAFNTCDAAHSIFSDVFHEPEA